ncbi:unnamed protein product [Arabis nemorensis]|uniref:Uncharacterized protein n=1 Tax=Arabis nemorensis TaxID=586526 RepID=A0A565C3C6_9BRAS|nr:unnamed protein product [Arabis nemorensis]
MAEFQNTRLYAGSLLEIECTPVIDSGVGVLMCLRAAFYVMWMMRLSNTSSSISHEIWHAFFNSMHLSPPTGFEQCILWLLSPSYDANITLVIRLAFQASLYGIWRERNARLHSSISTPGLTHYQRHQTNDLL